MGHLASELLMLTPLPPLEDIQVGMLCMRRSPLVGSPRDDHWVTKTILSLGASGVSNSWAGLPPKQALTFYMVIFKSGPTPTHFTHPQPCRVELVWGQ